MKNFFSFSAALLLLFIGSAFKGESCKPETGGIYAVKLDNEHSAVMRFYDDKTVIVSTSVNDYSQVGSWFNRDQENFSRVLSGKYKISGCTIRFKVKGETGYQKFEGTIGGNVITMHITNPDKTSTDRTYTFVKL